VKNRTQVTHRAIAGTVALVVVMGLSSAKSSPVLFESPPAVEVLVTVTDKNGKSVPGLSRADFKVFEDGKPQAITGFSDTGSLVSAIVIILDRSGSTRNSERELGAILDTSLPLIETLLQTGQAKAALVTTINSSVVINQNLTDDPSKLKEAINATRGQVWGGTSFYDALTSVASVLANFHGRKLILSIGDGSDTSSRFSNQNAIAALQRSNVVVEAIFMGLTLPGSRLDNPQRGMEILRRTAEETGGRLLNSKDMSQQFEGIRNDLAGQYNLQYQSGNPPSSGKFHKIRVEVPGKDYKVRHRPGH